MNAFKRSVLLFLITVLLLPMITHAEGINLKSYAVSNLTEVLGYTAEEAAQFVFDETETGKIKATLYKLDDTRNVDTLSWDMNELYNGPYETEVNIYLREDAQHKEMEEYV